MVCPDKPPPLAVHLECVSWRFVRHHVAHGALRFENEVVQYLQQLAAIDRESRFCLATTAEDPIEVVGVLHYRVADDDLYFDYIRVREAYWQRGVGRRMVTEVLTHPTCIRLSRVHWGVGPAGGEGLIRHLEWARENVRRLCGTPFQLVVG